MEHEYNCIIQAIEKLDKIEINLDYGDFNYNHSYSQGDGLSFDFNISSESALNFLNKIEVISDEELQKARMFIDSDFDLFISTYKNNFATHYCHSNTRDISIELYDSTDDDISNSLKNILEKINDSDKLIKQWYVEFCDSLFSELIEEYEEIEKYNNENDDFSELLNTKIRDY